MARSVWWVLIPLMLLLFWLGARGLYADTVWSDEYHSIEDAAGMPKTRLTFADIGANLAATNPWHAPGYFYTLHVWGRLVGWEPPSLRALSLLAGLLTAAWVYRLGRDLYSPRVGVFAACVLASSAFFLHFLHELRMYTLVTLTAAVMAWLYLRMVSQTSSPSRRQWLALFASGVALLYLHYFAATVMIGIGVFHVFFVRRNRRWRQFMLVFILAGVAFFPWVGALVSGMQRAATDEVIRELALSPAQAVEQLVRLAGNGSLPLLILVMGAALVTRRRAAKPILFITAAALLATVIVIAALKVMTPGRLRYFLPLWPLLAVILALGMTGLGRRLNGPLRSGVPVAVLLVWMTVGFSRAIDPAFLAGLDGAGPTFQLHLAAYASRDQIQPGDFVVQYLVDAPVQRSGGAARTTAQVYFRDLPVPYVIYPFSRDAEKKRDELAALIEQIPRHDRVWLIYDPSRAALDLPQILETIEASHVICPPVLALPEVRVEAFTRTREACPSARPAALPLDHS